MALKRTTEEARRYFKKLKYELLDEYTGCMVKMRYKCTNCNHISAISWNNISRGKRCPYCGKGQRKKKYTLEEVQKIFKDRGCELLEQEYKNNETPMQYKCKCGRTAKISLIGFKHQNQDCYYCGLEKNKKENHHGWIADRELKRENDLLRKRCYKALSSTLKACNRVKVGRTSDMLGYTPAELQEHVKSHPNWENVKDQEWHLDHIFPINAFLKHGIKDVKIINRLDNLQPLPGKENISKSDNYNEEEFLEWLEKR